MYRVQKKYFDIIPLYLSLHLLLTFIFLSIPFWPIKHLEFGTYLILLLTIIWVIFGKCPMHNKKSSLYSQDLLSHIDPDITTQHSENIQIFIIVLILMISFYRLLNNCRSKIGTKN